MFELGTEQAFGDVAVDFALRMQEPVEASDGRRRSGDRGGRVALQKLSEVAVDLLPPGQGLFAPQQPFEVVAVGGNRVARNLQFGGSVRMAAFSGILPRSQRKKNYRVGLP